MDAVAAAHVLDVSQADFAREVEEESRQRPVLVDFWAAWCGPCKALAPILTRVVEDFQGRVRLAKVDTDANRALAAQHGIRSLPTVRLYRDGKPVAEFMGAQPESAVREFLERFAGLGAAGPLAEARERMADADLDGAVALVDAHLLEQPDDTEARVLRAEIALAAGDPALARRVIDALPEAARLEQPVVALAARLKFAGAGSTATQPPQGDDIESRYQRALHAVSSGAVDEGMEGLLAIMAEDRGFRDDGARKALLDAFVLLGEGDPRVATYRGRLFSLLH